MPFERISDVHAYLEQLPAFQTTGSESARFDLERFRQYCGAAGNPQQRFPAIHIAGTNGKGSTAAILASIYREGGYAVGLYRSPHLRRFNERFRINGKEITDETLLAFFRSHHSLIERYHLTYFEISTAIAFWWYAREGVDLAILETGLGGRLDATNVVVPELSVITSVSLDHTGLLGSTIREIAREKAGIIKPRVPVVTGHLDRKAAAVVEEVAESRGSPLHGIDDCDLQWDGPVFQLRVQEHTFRACTGTQPPVQAYNLAVGWKVTQVLQQRFPLPEPKVRSGMEQLPERYPNRGRFERLVSDRQWYFDGAHNPEAVRAMKQAVSRVGPVSESVLVLSMMRDKVQEPVMNEFSEFRKIYYHELSTERAATLEEVRRWLEGTSVAPLKGDEVGPLLKEMETELVIFAGSFYFYATVRDWLNTFSTDR